MRRTTIRGICFGIALLATACRPNVLNLLSGVLAFSSPDDPAAVTKPDAGAVEIDFGPVAVGTTKTLTLDTVSLAGSVTLGALTPVQPDSEFNLPFISGTTVGSAPSDITVAFSPSSLGDKTAVYSLAYTTPTSGAVTIELAGEGVSSGLTVTPNPVDFGNVELNQQQPVSLTITNNTEAPANLVLSSLQGPNPNEFSLGVLSSMTLAAGASGTLNVVFGPLVLGPASASFAIGGAVIAGTPSSPTTVNLGGTGVQSWLQVTTPLDFGYLPPEETLVKLAAVKNAGSFTTLHLVAPAPRISQPSGSSAFALSSPQPVLPLAIAPGQTAQIPVSFSPPILGRYQGALSLATDDPRSPAPVIELKGNGGGPQILCLSPLDFGPVPLGHSGSLQTICVNAGTDIPNDSDGGLLIAQNNLSTDNPAFVATLTLPDGGLAGPDFSVSLAAGQSEAIDVTFQPDDARVYQDRLLVRSSDLGDTDAGVALTGEGLVPGLCSVEIVPSQLSFGEVPSGDTGILQFEIDNTGQNLCLVTGISLAAGSDPGFSLPGGNPGYQLLSFSGNSDNPVGLPTSLAVDVQFGPIAAEAAAVGDVDVTISNAAPSQRSVSLVAQSAAACLTIEPSSYDFGVVGFSPSSQQICVPDQKTFTALNSCQSPVTITAMAIAPGVDAPPQFMLESDLGLPLVVAPAGSAYFQASFNPSAVGARAEAIAVSTSEFPNAPFLVTLVGDAEARGSRTDTFTAAAPGKQLDLLWVLDNDDDQPAVSTVAGALPALIATLDSAQIDYQIAVTSTDTCDAGMSDLGSLEPCDHCLSTASPDPMLITPSTAAPAMALKDRFAFFDIPPQETLCENLIGDEHFFDALADAFSPALLAGHNSGFVRPGAELAVILVNGDTEDDKGGGSGPESVEYVTSLDQIMALLEGLKPDPNMVSVSYINAGGDFAAQPRMTTLVQATGGLEIDSNLSAWETLLLDLFPSEAGTNSFHLSSVPVGQIVVSVDGVMTKSWSYDSFLDDIVFSSGSVPAPGSTITVTYNVGCP